MEIRNTRVYGLEESLIASHYPMTTIDFLSYDAPPEEQDLERGTSLGRAKGGSGHDNFLKGIIVQADFRAPEYVWSQIKRYHFFEIVSSQSKMHKITQMDIANQFNKFVDPSEISKVEAIIRGYHKTKTKDNFQRIVANVPMGILLTARITTNYLQLKTIYGQRKNHKLEEWREVFIPWCNELPRFLELTQKEKK